MSLLQQIAAAREVVHPWTSLFCPGFVPVEPLPKRPKRQARCLAHERLVSRLVNHKAVDPVEQLLVRGRLQCSGRPGPRRGSRRQRLGRGQVLTIDMRHRRRFPVIRVVAVLLVVHARDLGPHCAHGHFVELLHFHAISDKGASTLVRFPIMAHAPLMQRGLQLAVMLVRNEIPDGLAKIP